MKISAEKIAKMKKSLKKYAKNIKNTFTFCQGVQILCKFCVEFFLHLQAK